MMKLEFNEEVCRACHEMAGLTWGVVDKILWKNGHSCPAHNCISWGDKPHNAEKIFSPPNSCPYFLELFQAGQKDIE
jgi:hypothetical protein